MSVTTDRPRAANTSAADLPPSPTGTRRPGRRSGRRVVAGVLLVLATVVTFWQVDLRRHIDEQFLAVARDVPAGQVITDADLRVAWVANPSGLALVPAQESGGIVGRTATVPLVAGSLLVSAQVGPVAWPAEGEAVIAVPVAPGRAPTSLTAGSRVVVLVAPAGGGGQLAPQQDDGVRRAVATVVSVTAGADQVGTQLVTVLLAADAAEAVASAAGDVSLVQLGPSQ
ncbi:SAF domain-containing protein [Micromonospora sp. Llam0]|uniref:SAF domain-containing protein n=1 Tax=Micromonospora sp. Llam0 TaxID=2485143 RepID=UPI000F475FE1|nr:SAF domain-containing protein [Micromonospora sp. Llam0]ROO52806.1 SAF domain-containing protein [Micromonospora sp. Llam0]